MTTALYETDFYQWTQLQAGLLRNEDYAELDLDNLIEEIESMGASERRELDSRLTVILAHLLKLMYEPRSKAIRGWKLTILTQRTDIRKLLRSNATLRATVAGFVPEAYQDARLLAAAGVDCSPDDFPVHCPWTADQILDVDWLP